MGSWPPLEVDMLTFSQLARADPLEDDQVVGETRTFGATDSTVRTCDA